MGDEVVFLPADKRESFLQVDSILIIARHAQSNQNNKFSISLQYLKKGVSNEVDPFNA